MHFDTAERSMITSALAIVAVLTAVAEAQQEAAPHTLNIIIDRVVAHTSSALVFSHGELKLSEGPHLIILRNLSLTPSGNQSLEEKSLQVTLEGGGALVERIVWDDVPLATQEELQALEDEMEAINVNRSRVRDKIILSESHMTTLQKFGNNIVAPSPELVQRGETIVQILRDAHAAQLDVGENIEVMRKQSKELNHKLQHLQAHWERSSQPQRVAKVHISVEHVATVVFHIQQIVASVTWRPYYEIDVSSTTGLVKMIYHALVHQRTGHTWTNVSMELCTGAPSTDRKLPSLTPWFVAATKSAGLEGFNSKRRHKKAKGSERRTRLEDFEKNPDGFKMSDSSLAHVQDDDEAEDEGRGSRFDGNDDSVASSLAQSEVVSSGVSDVFVLPKRQTIPPSYDIRVHIAVISLKANLTYTAVPKMSTKVYVQALVTNNSPFTLLPGSSLVFVDGSFVGSSHVNLIPINGQASVDVGIDNALSVVKKGVLAETKSTGGVWVGRTQTTEFQYDLVLKSMRPFGVTVQVKDQVPLPQSETLKVVVVKPEIGEVRADHKPANIDKNTTLKAGGEILWERYLFPDSTESIRLHYRIEVDSGYRIRNFDIGNFEL